MLAVSLGILSSYAAHAFVAQPRFALRGRGAGPRDTAPTRAAVALAVMPLPKGSLVALVTPMTPEGKVDELALRQLLAWHKQEGTDGVVILGTTGEASTLSLAEKELVMAVAKETVGGSLPIVVGTGSVSTAATIEATQHAALWGADAALVVTPYYVKPSQRGLLEHFTAVADACSDLPLVLYNVPGRTGVDLSVETTVALARHPNVCGLKDATGDNSRVAPLRAVCGDGFRMYSGEDGMAREYTLLGGDGCISVTANVAPAAVAAVMREANAAQRGGVKSGKQAAAALAADQPLQALHRDLFCEGNPVPVKWALARMGKLPSGALRLPLATLSEPFHTRVETALAQAGLIESVQLNGRWGERGKEGGGMLAGVNSGGWPTQTLQLSGHLFDTGLINQAVQLIETRGGDFKISDFSTQANDVNDTFNFKRRSSVRMTVYGSDAAALDDMLTKLQTLVDIMESAEGDVTLLPDDAAPPAA